MTYNFFYIFFLIQKQRILILIFINNNFVFNFLMKTMNGIKNNIKIKRIAIFTF